MVQDNLTVERINTAHPKIREELLEDYLECNNTILGKGVRLRFTSVLRTDEEQNKLFAIGRTVKGKKVTNAKAGESYHNYGLAFDFVLLYDNDGNGTFEEASWDLIRDGDQDKKADWMEVVNFFKKKGWFWGGNFKNFKDYPHLQKTFGLHWRFLKTLRKDANGYVILEDNQEDIPGVLKSPR